MTDKKCKPDCGLWENMSLFYDVDAHDFNRPFCPLCDKGDEEE